MKLYIIQLILARFLLRLLHLLIQQKEKLVNLFCRKLTLKKRGQPLLTGEAKQAKALDKEQQRLAKKDKQNLTSNFLINLSLNQNLINQFDII
jgi:hypothetical protein